MSRLPPRVLIIVAAAIVFTLATLNRFRWLGGPYFEFFPPTIQDYVWPERFASRDAIVLCRRIAKTLPRGATATVIQPSQSPNFDQTHWLTGLGMLPHQRVLPPKFEEPLPEYVVALREKFEHPAYRLKQSFPEGHLYEHAR